MYRQQLISIFLKEFIDGLRDRRSALMALFIGPIGLPVLFMAAMGFALKMNIAKYEDDISIPILGVEHAPNLVQFLRQNNLLAEELALSEAEIKTAVEQGRYDVALVIPAEFADTFRQGLPANIRVIADSSNGKANKTVQRLQAVLNAYKQKITVLRLYVRGITLETLNPLAIESVDVATPSGRAFIIFMMLPYVLFFAVLIGGLHMAIDMTAGERERGSLEPLLVLPVARSAIVSGKILATFSFMLIASCLAIMALLLTVQLLQLEKIGLPANSLNPISALQILLIVVPFALFGSTLFNLVASYAGSFKEAQTFLSFAMLVPVMPIAFISMLSLEANSLLMLLPSLSQGLLIMSILKAKTIPWLFVFISIISTLCCSALLWFGMLYRYQREKILI